MKKIAALISAGAMLLSVAAPALAISYIPRRNVNYARVRTETEVVANTGTNTAGNYAQVTNASVGLWSDINVAGSNTVKTGGAQATANVGITANKYISCCWGRSSRNVARVYTETGVYADTGNNTVGNGVGVANTNLQGDISASGNNSVTTGEASATANVYEVVNVNW